MTTCDLKRQRLQAGQVYNHCGRVDADAPVDTRAVEDMLALRRVYYDEHARRASSVASGGAAAAQGGDGARRKGKAARTAETDGGAIAAECEGGASGSRTAEAQGAACGTVPTEATRADGMAAAAAAPSTLAQAADVLQNAMVAGGGDSAEARAAERRYTQSVLAAAGLAEMHGGSGGREAERTGGQKRGGTAEKGPAARAMQRLRREFKLTSRRRQ